MKDGSSSAGQAASIAPARAIQELYATEQIDNSTAIEMLTKIGFTVDQIGMTLFVFECDRVERNPPPPEIKQKWWKVLFQ